MTQPRLRRAAIVLPFFALAGLLWGAIALGESRDFGMSDLVRGTAAALGFGDPLAPTSQTILELRLARALVAAATGAALASSGALLQGLFHNPLASPSVLGVTSGASLGATLAVITVGGYGPTLFVSGARALPLVVVPVAAFVGAVVVTLVVWRIGAGGSVATLLLSGIAVATLCGGFVQVIQGVLLSDWQVAQAIVEWGFGTLEDRSLWHAAPPLCALLATVVFVPFLTRELDLFGFGERDAQSLGVDARRVKVLVVLLSSALAGSAVAVAGQITFVGLIVPNLMRLVVGHRHARLLPSAAVFGAAFLLAVDLTQRRFLPDWNLRPGVLMSLVGAPFFLFLLARMRKGGSVW